MNTQLIMRDGKAYIVKPMFPTVLRHLVKARSEASDSWVTFEVDADHRVSVDALEVAAVYEMKRLRRVESEK